MPIGPPRRKHVVRIQHDDVDRTIEVDSDDILFGRGDDSTVRIDSPAVSRHHVRITVLDDQIIVRDLGSSNGSQMGQKKLKAHEDEIAAIGAVEVGLGKKVRITVTPFAAKPESLPQGKTEVLEIDDSHFNAQIVTNAELNTERKRLFERVSSLKDEITKLKAERIQCERDVESSKKKVEEKILKLQVDKIDLEKGLQALADKAKESHELHAKEDQELRILRAQTAEKVAELKKEREEAELHHQARVEVLQEEISSLQKQISQVQRDLDLAKKEHKLAELKTTECAEKELFLQAEAEKWQNETEKNKEEIKNLELEAAHKREEISKIDKELSDFQNRREESLKKFEEAKAQLAGLSTELEGRRSEIQREVEVAELESRRRKAVFETLDAEIQAKRTTLERAIEETKLEQTKAKRDLQSVLDQQADEQQRSKALDKKITELQSEVERLEKKAAENKNVESELESNRKAVAAIKDELTAFQEQLQSAKFLQKSEIEKEIRAIRASMELDLQKTKESELEKIAEETRQKKQEFEAELVRKTSETEQGLASVRLQKLNEIEKLSEERTAQEKARHDFMINEIVIAAIELSRQRDLASSEMELRKAVGSVLQGKTAGNLSADARKRTRTFWKRIAATAAAPCAIALFLYLFPSVPAYFTENISRKIASEKQEKGVFFDQIRQKGMKWETKKTHEFRKTYSDNILYAEGYVEMKTTEEEKLKWTLAMNDFLTGRLGLSDRILPNFISEESRLVTALFKIRENILPQFKDQGLARMAELEKTEEAALVRLLEGHSNYQKFRSFEKSYYTDYLSRISAATPENESRQASP